MKDVLLVTGGSGFIGTNFIYQWFQEETSFIVNIDKLTYAGNKENIPEKKYEERYAFHQGDICDRQFLNELFSRYKPRALINFAAETHVDRSLHTPDPFIQTNIMGTYHLLEESLSYWKTLSHENQKLFRFHHISTDEVYGSLTKSDAPFTENHPYCPTSPYSASKASSDHLVNSFHHSFGLPTVITNCSNNYGPYQHPEKLIPLTLLNALQGKPIPIYGEGKNERNWLFVNDHCQALRLALSKATAGSTYNIGDSHSRENLEVVQIICDTLDQLFPQSKNTPHSSLISHVKDRPGHDFRYDIDSSKIERELNWKPSVHFEEGIQTTIHWYLNHQEWLTSLTNEEFHQWIKTHYR